MGAGGYGGSGSSQGAGGGGGGGGSWPLAAACVPGLCSDCLLLDNFAAAAAAADHRQDPRLLVGGKDNAKCKDKFRNCAKTVVEQRPQRGVILST